MKKGSVTIGWLMGLAGIFIASTFGYALRNEGVNATQTADISNITKQLDGLRDAVVKEVQMGVQQGIKDGIQEAIKEMSYNDPKYNVPAVEEEAPNVPLVVGTKKDGSPLNSNEAKRK